MNKKELNFSVTSSLFSDNNIYEKINDPKIADEFFQLWVNTGITLKKRNQSFSMNLNGHSQNYFDHTQENKLFGRFNFDFFYNIDRKNLFSLTGYYSKKDWQTIDKHYNYSLINLSHMFRQKSVSITSSITTGHYLFSYFSEFDHIYYGFRPKIIVKKSKNLSYSLCYERRLYDYLNPFIKKERFDKSHTFKIGFEYKNGLILGTNLQYAYTGSNYKFLINNSLLFMPYLSAEYKDFYYQIIIKWNLKKYQTQISTNQINLIFPDPEANTNNQFYFGIDRDITQHLAVTGKIIFFASEYRFQDDFYEKFLFGLGLKYSL